MTDGFLVRLDDLEEARPSKSEFAYGALLLERQPPTDPPPKLDLSLIHI